MLLKYYLAASVIIISLESYAQTIEPATPQWRPVFHFTPEKNWTNDPNGLLYLNGEYHLYNQQNPFENKWGHMSWGHAVSTDLIHWKHLPVAIPEKINGDDTVWIFSGSAVWDKNNTSGFCKTDGCIVAAYTAHQPHIRRESQYIAYSNDGGITFTNYEKNPVIDLNRLDFRDPNVFWYEPGKFWLMTVVVPDKHKAQFYSSPDLKDWTLLSEFGPQGYTGANWECPFLIELPVEGTSQKKWVLVISAAGGERGVFEQYFVGDFNGKEFKNNNAANEVLALDDGDTYYAAIPWNNAPADKKIYIGWMIPKQQPTHPWRGQMSIPRDLRLQKTSEGIRLYQQPSSVVNEYISRLSPNKKITKSNQIIKDGVSSISTASAFNKNSWWLKASIDVSKAQQTGVKIATAADNSATATVLYDVAANKLTVMNGKDVSAHRYVNVKPVNGKINLEVLMDKSSLEVFINNGEKVITTYIFPEVSATGLSLFAKGSVTVTNIEVYDLSD